MIAMHASMYQAFFKLPISTHVLLAAVCAGWRARAQPQSWQGALAQWMMICMSVTPWQQVRQRGVRWMMICMSVTPWQQVRQKGVLLSDKWTGAVRREIIPIPIIISIIIIIISSSSSSSTP
jgi:hypothetical protein